MTIGEKIREIRKEKGISQKNSVEANSKSKDNSEKDGKKRSHLKIAQKVFFKHGIVT